MTVYLFFDVGARRRARGVNAARAAVEGFGHIPWESLFKYYI